MRPACLVNLCQKVGQGLRKVTRKFGPTTTIEDHHHYSKQLSIEFCHPYVSLIAQMHNYRMWNPTMGGECQEEVLEATHKVIVCVLSK